MQKHKYKQRWNDVNEKQSWALPSNAIFFGIFSGVHISVETAPSRHLVNLKAP